MHDLKSLIYRSFIPNVSISYETVNTSYDTICNYSKNGYRYGFNGKEKVNETSGEGDSYDFIERMYKSRIGRWHKIDNYFYRYNGFSLYNFVFNLPTILIDKDGNDPIDPRTGKIFKIYLYHHSVLSFNINGCSNNASDSILQDRIKAFKFMGVRKRDSPGVIYDGATKFSADKTSFMISNSAIIEINRVFLTGTPEATAVLPSTWGLQMILNGKNCVFSKLYLYG